MQEKDIRWHWSMYSLWPCKKTDF